MELTDKFFVGFTILLEALAATGLAIVLFPKLGACLAIIVLLGTSYTIVKINGFNWRWQKMGPEFPLFWALVMAATLFI